MKSIWMMNHYATQLFHDKAGRHYWFAKELNKRGYDVSVFCATTILNSDESIDTGNHVKVLSFVPGRLSQ